MLARAHPVWLPVDDAHRRRAYGAYGRWARVLSASLTALLCAGCATTTGPARPPEPASDPAAVNVLSAAELVTALDRAGLPVGDPVDLTDVDCPSTGCTQKIGTDTVAVWTFPTTASAALFHASTPRSFQVVNVVLTYPADTDPAQRQRYQTALTRAIA